MLNIKEQFLAVLHITLYIDINHRSKYPIYQQIVILRNQKLLLITLYNIRKDENYDL